MLDASYIKFSIIQSPPLFNMLSLQIKIEANFAEKAKFEASSADFLETLIS